MAHRAPNIEVYDELRIADTRQDWQDSFDHKRSHAHGNLVTSIDLLHNSCRICIAVNPMHSHGYTGSHGCIRGLAEVSQLLVSL